MWGVLQFSMCKINAATDALFFALWKLFHSESKRETLRQMKKLSTSYKVLTSIMAGISCAFCLMRIGHRFLAEWLPMSALWVIVACLLLAGLVYGIYWAFIKQSDQDDPKLLAFWQAIIRYTIAIDLTMLGMQGVFGWLFFVRLGALDFPFSSLSGEDLTWAYFGHYSTGMLYFIGFVQILGSILILFRRTSLMGIFTLIPVMVTIVAVNYFFDMERAETSHAIELLAQLLYLLFTERQRLYAFFIKDTSAVFAAPLKPLVKNLMRLSVLFIPLFLLWRYDSLHPKPRLIGKYQVSHLLFDHHDGQPQPCTDTLLTRVYFDLGNECIFEFNSPDRRWYGIYQLSDGNKKIAVTWHYPVDVHDTLTGEIRKDGIGSSLSINGKIGKDSIQVNLVKKI